MLGRSSDPDIKHFHIGSPYSAVLSILRSAIGDEASTAQEKATFEFTDPSGKPDP